MRDRFLARGAVPARLWHTFQRGRNAAIESLANTTVPFAALHGEADRYAPIEATRTVFDAIGARLVRNARPCFLLAIITN